MSKKPNVFEQRRRQIDEASGWAAPTQKKRKPKKLPPLGKRYNPSDYPR